MPPTPYALKSHDNFSDRCPTCKSLDYEPVANKLAKCNRCKRLFQRHSGARTQ